MFDDWRRASSFNSLSRMLLQTLMQLSQMYTPGPAISLRTSAWLLPQKLHMVRLEARAMTKCDACESNGRRGKTRILRSFELSGGFTYSKPAESPLQAASGLAGT